MKNNGIVLLICITSLCADSWSASQEKTTVKRFANLRTPLIRKPRVAGRLTVKGDIAFWNARMRDHLRYLNDIITAEPAFKNRGKELFEVLKKTGRELNTATINPSYLSNYKKQLADIRTYTQDALKKAGSNRVSKGVIQHMLEEMQYHEENIDRKKRSVEQEKAFWARHDKEVAAVGELKKTGTDEEKRVVEHLEKLGIEKHEKREDKYSRLRIAHGAKIAVPGGTLSKGSAKKK